MNKTMLEIRKVVAEILAEAKKKKEKADELKHEAKPAAYSYDDAFDFSAPLGAYNLYKTQGASNWGPMTGPGTKIDDRIAGQTADSEKILRKAVREAIKLEMKEKSAWSYLAESSESKKAKPGNVWEAAMAMSDEKETA